MLTHRPVFLTLVLISRIPARLSSPLDGQSVEDHVGETFANILGREPASDTVIRDGDIVVIYGQPEELERAESVLLAG